MKKEFITLGSGILIILLTCSFLQLKSCQRERVEQQKINDVLVADAQKLQEKEAEQKEIERVKILRMEEIDLHNKNKLDRLEKEREKELENIRLEKLKKIRNASNSDFLRDIALNPARKSRPEFKRTVRLVGQVTTIRPDYVIFTCQYVDDDAFMNYSTISVKLVTNDIERYNKGEWREFSGLLVDVEHVVFTTIVLYGYNS